MPPTMMRMAYLTLRGLAVARLIASVGPVVPGVVEVHPGAVMALRGAPLEWVRSFKRDKDARRGLLAWLKSQNLHGFPNFGKQEGPEDHMIAAYAAALGAWDWAKNKPRWLAPAQPPIHPYDFAC
jgi:predicted nuclease with RNAse H fold